MIVKNLRENVIGLFCRGWSVFLPSKQESTRRPHWTHNRDPDTHHTFLLATGRKVELLCLLDFSTSWGDLDSWSLGICNLLKTLCSGERPRIRDRHLIREAHISGMGDNRALIFFHAYSSYFPLIWSRIIIAEKPPCLQRWDYFHFYVFHCYFRPLQKWCREP